MFRIVLINMPFANLAMPSIALTQLKYVVEAEFGDRVSSEVLYLNQEFANYLGLDFYEFLTGSPESQNSGLGEWFFRQAAFPDQPNNASPYLTRYFPFRTEQANTLKSRILEKRRGLEAFLDRLIDKYRLHEADLVGFTSMFMQNVSSFAMARKLKARRPEIVTVMGGANCESPMGQVIARHVPQVDFVFSGPGLRNFPQLVGHCLDGEPWKGGSIKGVFTKKNYLFHTGADAIGEELGIEVPIKLDYEPFLEGLSANFPRQEISPILLFETSRGCWWGERAHCTFCGLNGMSMAYRAMPNDVALEQFDALFKFAPRVKRLDAVDNILPKNYFQEVLPYVETPPGVEMFYEVKADLSEEDVRVLARARVKHIQPGIESLATSTLKLMKKGTSVFSNLSLLKYCAKYGISPGWNLLIGFPGEKEEVYQKYVRDLPLLVHLPPPSGVFPVRFDRYSPYFVQAAEYNLALRPLDYYGLTYPFDEESLAQMAYYFADANVSAEYAQLAGRWIGQLRELVGAWSRAWRGGGAEPPQLTLRGGPGEWVVFDSRGGAGVEHRLSEGGRRVLEAIGTRAKRVSEVVKETAGEEGLDVAGEMAGLQEKGLVFQEGDRFLSLVFVGGEGA